MNRRTIRQWGHDAAIEAKAREQEEFEEFELLKCRSRLRYQKITTEILPAVRQASQVGNETVPVEKKENVRLVKKDKSVYQGEQRSKTRKSRF